MIPSIFRSRGALRLGLVALGVFMVGGTALAAGGAGGGQGSFLSTFFVQENANTGRIEWIGSLIVWLLIALSVACVAMICTLAWENRRVTIMPPNLTERMRRLIRERHIRQAVEELASSGGSFFAQVLQSALSESPNGPEAMIRAGELTAEEISGKRLRRLEPLSVLGNVAPMIGLFGTVYGIILAFREIVASGGTPDPVSLAAGIGTALVTTFWGLVVAIPALSAYGLIRNQIDGQTVEACRAVEQMLVEYRNSTLAHASSTAGRVSGGSRGAGQEAIEAVAQGVR